VDRAVTVHQEEAVAQIFSLTHHKSTSQDQACFLPNHHQVHPAIPQPLTENPVSHATKTNKELVDIVIFITINKTSITYHSNLCILASFYLI
jgi:hypothetical protein